MFFYFNVLSFLQGSVFEPAAALMLVEPLVEPLNQEAEPVPVIALADPPEDAAADVDAEAAEIVEAVDEFLQELDGLDDDYSNDSGFDSTSELKYTDAYIYVSLSQHLIAYCFENLVADQESIKNIEIFDNSDQVARRLDELETIAVAGGLELRHTSFFTEPSDRYLKIYSHSTCV